MSTTTHEQAEAAATESAARADANDSHAAMEAVRRLMDERRRFEGWLATLETRRESTPPRVYERVSGDYEQRLDAVIGELRGHTAMLRTMLADLNERAQALRAEEETRREERAEGELRAAVGEYSSDRWQEIAAAADAEIERLTNGRGEVTAELARVQEMLAQTEAPRTPPGGQSAVSSEPAVAAVEVAPEPVAEPEPAIEAAPVAEAAPITQSDSSLGAFYQSDDQPLASIDALEFDSSASTEPEVAAVEPAPVAEAMPVDRRSPAVGAPAIDMLGGAMAFDELAFLKSVVGPRGESSAPRSGPAAAVEDRKSARRETSSTPGYAEAAKTLRCGECGTMNAPTEWYCERCGGELAAL